MTNTAAKEAVRTAVRDAATRVGAAVLKEQFARQEVAKELELAADRWQKQADALPYVTGNEFQDYLRTKAKNARKKAQELREGKK